jgi:hypothetical protein
MNSANGGDRSTMLHTGGGDLIHPTSTRVCERNGTEEKRDLSRTGICERCMREIGAGRGPRNFAGKLSAVLPIKTIEAVCLAVLTRTVSRKVCL